MPFLPPLPQDPAELQAFKDLYKRELIQFRRRPSYIAGVLLALLSGLGLVYLGSSTQRLIMIAGILGCSLIFDTITRHFTMRLLQQQPTPPRAAPSTEH